MGCIVPRIDRGALRTPTQQEPIPQASPAAWELIQGPRAQEHLNLPLYTLAWSSWQLPSDGGPR